MYIYVCVYEEIYYKDMKDRKKLNPNTGTSV